METPLQICIHLNIYYKPVQDLPLHHLEKDINMISQKLLPDPLVLEPINYQVLLINIKKIRCYR